MVPSETPPTRRAAPRRSRTTMFAPSCEPAPPHLSPRQLACLHLVASGRSSSQIAQALGISSRTVDQHIADACARLRVNRRVHAVLRAVASGLIGVEVPLAHASDLPEQ